MNLIRPCEFVATVAASAGSVCLYTCSYFIVNSADRTLKYAQQLGQNQDANKTGPGREGRAKGGREEGKKRRTPTEREAGFSGLAVHIYYGGSQV